MLLKMVTMLKEEQILHRFWNHLSAVWLLAIADYLSPLSLFLSFSLVLLFFFLPGLFGVRLVSSLSRSDSEVWFGRETVARWSEMWAGEELLCFFSVPSTTSFFFLFLFMCTCLESTAALTHWSS